MLMAMAGINFWTKWRSSRQLWSQYLKTFITTIPIAGFYSTTHIFNQYAYYTLAFTGDPDSKTFVESFSNTGHDFVFLKANLSDNTTNIDDIYPGIFADWDIGNYSTE